MDTANECLFKCRSADKHFTGIEHIIPESLGNKTLVLERVVCDKCNSYYHKLEEYFVHHHITSASRLIRVQKTKHGKQPSQRLIKGEARRKGDKLSFKQPMLPGRELDQFSITFHANDGVIKWSSFLPDADALRLSRLLAKMGLEILYVKRGDHAYSAEFDPVRKYARYGQGIKFIPFLWKYQHDITTDARLLEMEHGTEGFFYFGALCVPGCFYLIPLNRLDSKLAFNDLVNRFSMNSILVPGPIKRDPIVFEARFGPDRSSPSAT